MRMRMSLSFSFTLSFSLIFTLFFVVVFFYIYNIKMSYYWCNRQEILQRAKEIYSKEKAAEYYKQNKKL